MAEQNIEKDLVPTMRFQWRRAVPGADYAHVPPQQVGAMCIQFVGLPCILQQWFDDRSTMDVTGVPQGGEWLDIPIEKSVVPKGQIDYIEGSDNAKV